MEGEFQEVQQLTVFSSLHRHLTMEALNDRQLDVLVIGGGITGAGIALDASSRGLKTGLVEMQDFAAGTSSRSTKLIHGGLRYLKQLQIKMVADVGKERAIVYENGPHITTPEKMMLPFYRGGDLGPLATNLGLLLYDYLAKVDKTERRKMLSVKEALLKEPLLKRKNLLGAGLYVEYKTDDARLVIEVLKKAAEFGTHVINYTKVTDFLYKQNKIIGVRVEDQITNKTYEIKAKKVINATGPWVDRLRELDQTKDGKSLHLTKGVHLVFSKKDFPLKQAIYFDTPDERMIFAIPRGNKTYVGTTDTAYMGDLSRPTVTEDDRDYLLQAIHYMFPSLEISKEHIESSWAGLRPLIADDEADSPSEISRKDEIFLSPSGLISIAGGKLTGYRKMAEKIVDIITEQLKKEEGILYSPSATKQLPLSGGDVGGSAGFALYKERKKEAGMELGLSEKEAYSIAETYGSNTDILFDYYVNVKKIAEERGIDPLLLSRLVYAMEYEAAYTPADFFVRRLGALYFQMELIEQSKEKVIDYMADKIGWSEEQKAEYSRELNELIDDAKSPAQ